MAARSQYEELSRHLSGLGAIQREMARGLPPECPPASAAVLSLLSKYGEMRASRLSELMAIDMSVTSRHVTHVADRGWIGRHPDPQDGRSRLLRLTDEGQQLLNALSEQTTEALESYMHDWSDDEVAQLNVLLSRLRTSFGDCRTRAHHDARQTTARQTTAGN